MPEILVVFVVVLMLFGSKKLPDLARGLGKGIREFKRATNEFKSELDMEAPHTQFRREIKESVEEIKDEITKPAPAERKNDNSNSADNQKS